MRCDLRLGDCREILREVDDASVDLVVMDPPYRFDGVSGGGAFGSANRSYHSELENISQGIDSELLDLIVSKLRAVNAYIFCSKAQIPFYLDHFIELGCNYDLLTWHKTNPTPACSNKYLSDTEYIIYVREKGVKLRGTYATKRKWWVTPVNREDRERYGHPTVKPLEIVETLVGNSISGDGHDVVLDPFMGTGTTGVAAMDLGCSFIGIELDRHYFTTAMARLDAARSFPRKGALDRFVEVEP